jgi:tetratricopeptide (TPR) repeat protein
MSAQSAKRLWVNHQPADAPSKNAGVPNGQLRYYLSGLLRNLFVQRRYLLLVLALGAIQLAYPAARGGEPRQYSGSVQSRELGGFAEAEEGLDRSLVGLRYLFMAPLGVNELLVASVIKGSPAEQAGVRRADCVLNIDGRSIKGMTRSDVQHYMRGEPGSKVVLTIRRRREVIDIPIIRKAFVDFNDSKFKASLRHQHYTDERDGRIQRLAQTLLFSAANRASPALATSIPFSARMKSKELCDSARFQIERSQYQDALKTLDAAQKFDPEFWDSQYMRALLLDRLQRYAEAQPILEKCASSEMRSCDSLQALAACYEDQGKLADALSTLKKSAVLTSDGAEESNVRIKIYEITKALATGSSSVSAPEPKVSPSDLVSVPVQDALSLADSAIEQGQYDNAIANLEKALMRDGCSNRAWYLLGYCRQKKENWAKAIDAYKAYIKKCTDTEEGGASVASTYLSQGTCQLRIDLNADAIDSFNASLKHEPTAEQSFYAWHALHSLYFRTGKLGEGLDCLREAVKADKDLAHAEGVDEIVDGLEATLSHTRIGSADSDNYFGAVKKESLCRWARTKRIKVYIASGAGIKQYNPEYETALRDAFAAWSDASGGKLGFEFVKNAKAAKIQCFWLDDPAKLSGPLRAGETCITPFLHQIDHVRISILTVPTHRSYPPVSVTMMKSCTLHEVGHALGISAHSFSPEDIMYPCSQAATISERDRKTLAALYECKMPRDAVFNSAMHNLR